MVSKIELEPRQEITLKMTLPEDEVVPRNVNGVNLFINEGVLIIDFFFADITLGIIESDKGPIRRGYLVSRVSLSPSMVEKLKKQIADASKHFKQLKEGE